jgi:hypothetical protein
LPPCDHQPSPAAGGALVDARSVSAGLATQRKLL